MTSIHLWAYVIVGAFVVYAAELTVGDVLRRVRSARAVTYHNWVGVPLGVVCNLTILLAVVVLTVLVIGTPWVSQ
jgi:hypothetical protein